MQSKKIFYSVLIPVLVLCLLRVSLPYILLSSVNHRLSDITDFKGHIKDLDLGLLSGQVILKEIELVKQPSQTLFSAPRAWISLDWQALRHKALNLKVQIQKPQIEILLESQAKKLAKAQSLRQQLQTRFPVMISQLQIQDAYLHLRDITKKPYYDLYLKDMEINGRDLCNTDQTQMHARVHLSAKTIDGAAVKLSIAFAPMAPQPHFDLDAQVEEIDLRSLNLFLQHYSKIKVNRGWFSLYVEAAAKQGKIVGYAKPLLKKVKVIDGSQEDLPTTQRLYRRLAQTIHDVLENKQQKTVATKVKIKGNIDDPNADIWSTVSQLLKHAFIQALLPRIDKSIEIKDIVF